MVRRYRRKRYYPTASRMLLHLAAEANGPEARTQDAIAAATLSGRSTITKWLGRLVARGLMLRERAHVAGYDLPKFVYALTDAGWTEVGSLRGRMASETVELRSPSLGTLPVRVADVPTLLSPRMTLVTAVSLVRQGRLDAASAPGPSPERGESVVWGSSLRQVERLFGRSAELRLLDRWHDSRDSVLLVTGLAGIGKSALVAGWIQRRRPRAHVFVFQLHRSTKASRLLGDLASFLENLGRRNLSTLLTQGGTPPPRLVQRVLARDLARLPVLIVIDSLEQATRDAMRFIRGPLIGVLPGTETKMVLISRRLPSWTAAAGQSTPVEILHVRGLDPAASVDLLRDRGYPADVKAVGKVVSAAQGHPLLLHLAAQGTPGEVQDIQGYLTKEVWESLNDEERRALETASQFRRAVSSRVIEDAAGVRPRAIAELRSKNLLEQTVVGRYLVHDLVSEFIRHRIGESRNRELHESAARPLLRSSDPVDRWEGVYHLITANRMHEAAAFLDSEGVPLRDSIAAEEVASLTRGLRLERLDPPTACIFAELSGDSLTILGHIGPARYQYGHARKNAEALGQTARIPRILRKLAYLERCRGRLARALGYLVEAQARLSQSPGTNELIEILREMALAEQATGELGKAATHLNEAVDLATEASDQASLSRALLALGSLETQRGHREEGLQYNLEGLRIAERSGNLTEVARAHIVVGTGLAELGRLGESLDYYEHGLEIARLLGNLRLTAYATLNRAAALVDLGRTEDAGVAIRNAQGYFGILEERDTLGLLKVYEGNRERRMHRWSRACRAWGEGLSALRGFGTPVDLVRALREIGGYYLEHGDAKPAKVLLVEAEGIARKLANATLLSEIRSDLDRVSPSLHAVEDD